MKIIKKIFQMLYILAIIALYLLFIIGIPASIYHIDKTIFWFLVACSIVIVICTISIFVILALEERDFRKH